MAGNSNFPLLFVTDPANPERAIGITLNPESGTVSDAVRDNVSWISLHAFDPQNRWHTYAIRYSVIMKDTHRQPGEKAHHYFISFFVDGKQIGGNVAIPQAVSPGAIWIASNPVADVTAWISKIEVNRVQHRPNRK